MADLQESLDGARAELATKRREEKESRTREAQLGTQICTVSSSFSARGTGVSGLCAAGKKLELEMQHLQQQLSTARESHATQQRMLQDANGELRARARSRIEDSLCADEDGRRGGPIEGRRARQGGGCGRPEGRH